MPFDGPYADKMTEYGFIPADHKAPQFFKVEARKMYDETGEEIEGYRRIVNSDLKKTLHFCTDAYSLVTNEEAFGQFELALAKSSLDLTDMQVATDYSAFGARCFRQYMLPAHIVQVKDGVDVALRIIMMNSYDGSMKFRGCSGAYNFVCANTSIFGTDYGKFEFSHRGKVEVSKAIAGLVTAAEEHVGVVQHWKRWPNIAVTDQQAIKAAQSLPKATKSRSDGLIHDWLDARDDRGPQGGPNLWALYNVFTAWASHDFNEIEGGKGDARFERERQVAELVNGKVWKELEAA
jgi:hypothetical protein